MIYLVNGHVNDWELEKETFSYAYLSELKKFLVQKHEYNSSNSLIYFDEREDALNYIKQWKKKQ